MSENPPRRGRGPSRQQQQAASRREGRDAWEREWEPYFVEMGIRDMSQKQRFALIPTIDDFVHRQEQKAQTKEERQARDRQIKRWFAYAGAVFTLLAAIGSFFGFSAASRVFPTPAPTPVVVTQSAAPTPSITVHP